MECPLCTMDEILVLKDQNECVTCGHEWTPELKK
jgi:Zn ribbon nucleic-acid-binding protein